jgi:starvation-inducible DNA-binding protein
MYEEEMYVGDDMPIGSVEQMQPTSHEVLAGELTRLLGTTVVFKFLAQGAHWNVKGKDFNEFHDFFGEIYEDAEEATDRLAELIRQLDYDAPFMLTDLMAVSECMPKPCASDCISFTQEIADCNAVIIGSFKRAFDCANECNEQGIANFLAERIDAHMKLAWKLRATLHDSNY